jgi:L-amino acid N-acyltransferase YncA
MRQIGKDDTGHQEIVIRPAHPGDVPAITAIYNEGIVDRIATLETDEKSISEREEWFASRDWWTPVFVAEAPGSVVGWSSLNRFNPRPAYRFVADISVYVRRANRGTGIGSALLSHLIEIAPARGYHKLVLAAFPFNASGIALYRKQGFRVVGTYYQQGVLDGRWVDTIVMEKLLDDLPPQ